MLIISVIVIAVVAATYIFVPTFQSGVLALSQDVSTILDGGRIGGAGTDRGTGGMGPGGANSASLRLHCEDIRYGAMFDPPPCITSEVAPVMQASPPAR